MSINVRVHDGRVLGSLFAKLFSKVAVKTAAKAAAKTLGTVAKKGLKVAVQVGKKGVKIAGREGLKIAKDVGREVGKDLINTGVEVATDLALQGIDSLAQKATNKVGPSKLIQSVQDHARGRTLAGATALTLSLRLADMVLPFQRAPFLGKFGTDTEKGITFQKIVP